MHTYISILLFSGAAGGFLNSLSGAPSYKLQIPFYQDRKTIDTGFLGHIFAGTITGVVGVFFAAKILELDIWVWDLHTSNVDAGGKICGVKRLFTISSLAILSGYLGISMISKLANAMLKQLANDVDELKKEADETKADELCTRAKLQNFDNNYREAIVTVEKSISLHETPRAWGVKAKSYKLMDRCDLAISCLNKAISLDETDPGRIAIYYWNRACYKSMQKEEPEGIVADLEMSISYAPEFEKDLKGEPDLEYIRGKEIFDSTFK